MTNPAIRRPGQPDADALAQTALADLAGDDATPATPPAPGAAAPGAKADDDADVMTPEKFSALPPIERWRYNLKTVGITEAEALEIIDAQLDPGYWTRAYTIFFGRVRVVLRTRDAIAHIRAQRALDTLPTATLDAAQAALDRMNTINSLQEITLSLPGKPEEHAVFEYFPASDVKQEETAYVKRRTFVENIKSESLLRALFATVREFDRRVSASLSEGAVEGFSVPAGA